jgi:hypothetical protein
MRQPETRSPATVATIARAGRKVLFEYANNIQPLSVLQALLPQARATVSRPREASYE